ncbi:TPA: hypothetical protein ACXYKD_004069, partial [Legionella anisa]
PLDHLFGKIYKIYDLMMWNALDKSQTNINGLRNFYNSPYYKELPHVYLKCSLLAKIKTSTKEIRSGDPMDIQHTADMLPFSDLYITDKKWRDFLKEQQFDIQYSTKILYIGDEEEIKNFFERAEIIL